ncbi:MAG: NAD(P) transhydrogenase subunit alpha [Planctomycetota bacterium]
MSDHSPAAADERDDKLEPEQPKERRPIITALPVQDAGERRAAITPESVATLTSAGWRCVLPEGLGHRAGFSDDAYLASGCEMVDRVHAAIADADAVACVEPPSDEIVRSLRRGSLLIGLLAPFARADLIETAALAGVSSIAMELVPRSTIAQPMDALSSQASLAGYAAVLRAADRLPRVFPMMSTPAGTIPPARVLVVGTGVAGLQAIATAVRLGARVSAYDVRAAAKEQVESLGARFVSIESASGAETRDGYATAQSDEQLASQRQALAETCAASDVIITTAQIFGKPAPTIIDRGMIAGMRTGSVIVDAAIATGGNVEGAAAGDDTVIGGVSLIADPHLASSVAAEASRMYASNIASLLAHITPEGPTAELDPGTNDILASVLVTHADAVRTTAATAHAGGAATP